MWFGLALIGFISLFAGVKIYGMVKSRCKFKKIMKKIEQSDESDRVVAFVESNEDRDVHYNDQIIDTVFFNYTNIGEEIKKYIKKELPAGLLRWIKYDYFERGLSMSDEIHKASIADSRFRAEHKKRNNFYQNGRKTTFTQREEEIVFNQQDRSIAKYIKRLCSINEALNRLRKNIVIIPVNESVVKDFQNLSLEDDKVSVLYGYKNFDSKIVVAKNHHEINERVKILSQSKNKLSELNNDRIIYFRELISQKNADSEVLELFDNQIFKLSNTIDELEESIVEYFSEKSLYSSQVKQSELEDLDKELTLKTMHKLLENSE